MMDHQGRGGANDGPPVEGAGLTMASSSADAQINKVLSHPTLPVTMTAQEDRHIRFYDNNTGRCC